MGIKCTLSGLSVCPHQSAILSRFFFLCCPPFISTLSILFSFSFHHHHQHQAPLLSLHSSCVKCNLIQMQLRSLCLVFFSSSSPLVSHPKWPTTLRPLCYRNERTVMPFQRHSFTKCRFFPPFSKAATTLKQFQLFAAAAEPRYLLHLLLLCHLEADISNFDALGEKQLLTSELKIKNLTSTNDTFGELYFVFSFFLHSF